MQKGDVPIEAWISDDDHLCVRVLDERRGADPAGDSPGLGVGFGLIAQMADDFHV